VPKSRRVSPPVASNPVREVASNGLAGVELSRRTVLTSISLAALTLMTSSGFERSQPRLFGLAASGVDAAAVQRSRATAQALGKHLDVLTVYDAFARGKPLPTALLDTIAAVGSVPEITWEPWNPDDGPHQPLYTAGQIAGGRYDAYVLSWAKQAAAYDRRFLLRFAHEMNGDWYPWSVGTSGALPEDYVGAYRRVRRIFNDAGAKRVQWVWSPNVIINGDVDIVSRSYPGDQFVDIIGVDGYNFGNAAGHQWTQPADLFGSTLNLAAKIAPAKPVWINEVGCSDRGGDKAQWISDFITWLTGTDVCGLIWFEASDPGEPDWRLTGTPATTAAAKAAARDW
jgi:mannan endo-1,4-beta-mannosidase